MPRIGKPWTARLLAGATLAVVLSAGCLPAAAQAERKGTWEPVNYPADLELADVFFVTPEKGYVSGAAGTLLATGDGGETWTVLLGGDPAGTEPAIERLRFVSETVGWAAQVTSRHTNLLHTRNGVSWAPVGTMSAHYSDYAFTSETEGVYAYNTEVYRTGDAGRTWTKAWDCRARGEINGLSREVDCWISRMHFPTPSVGYAVAAGDGAAWVLRTDDGGSTWQAVTPILGEYGRSSAIFFVDESTGIVRTHSGRAFRTTDGGMTWTPLAVSSLGEIVRFADPGVGWSFAGPCSGMGCGEAQLSFTLDGGERWTTRSIPFPAGVRAFSLPRRDAAYVVGDHGMIYRYRSLPADAPVAPKAIASVAMPALDTEVLARIDEAEEELAALETALAQAQGAAGVGAAAGDDFVAADAAAAEWLPESVVEQFAPLEEDVATIAAELPEMGSRHRNLNLVLVGLRLLSDLTGQGAGLKQAFADLRDARDLGSMSVALDGLRAQLDAARTSVDSFVLAEGEMQ